MAFATGNLGKEILQKAMKNIAFKPSLSNRHKKNQSSSTMDGDRPDPRASLTSPQNDPISHTLLPHSIQVGDQCKCTCNVCQEKSGIKPKPATLAEVNKPKVRIVQGNEKGFSYLLRILLPDKGNAPKGLKFLIAETLVFMGGEPRYLVYNSRDKYMRFTKHKDRLSLKEMMKFFQARKQRKELDGINFFNENTITMSRKIRDAKMKAYEEKMAEETALYNRQDPKANKKEVKMVEATAHREIVICKYTDGSLQVLSELDFSYLMMKRKIEAVWSQLDYIQSYIKLNKDHPYYIRVDYDHDHDRKNPLYERARDFIYYLVEEKEPELEGYDYATAEDHFEENLKNKNIYEYCQYINFKMVVYLDAYCAARVKYMTCEYAWEDTGLVYLANANKIKFFNLDELDEYTLKEVEIVNEEEKQKAMDKIYGGKPSPYQGKVEVLWAFRQYYDEMKKDMDINKAFEDSILENPASNEAFRMINPEASFTLYDVMTNPKQFEAFKQWLSARSVEPGVNSKTYKSALKYTETSTSFHVNSTTRSVRSTARKQDQTKTLIQDNSAKNFEKKLKVLDISGNGASKKKYIHPSEILYRSDVFSGKKMFLQDTTPKRLMIPSYNNIITPTPTEQLTKKTLSRNETPLSQMSVRKFRIRAQKTPTQQNSTLDQTMFNKTKSLASILYLKGETPTI